jgi:hypothetical protein
MTQLIEVLDTIGSQLDLGKQIDVIMDCKFILLSMM